MLKIAIISQFESSGFEGSDVALGFKVARGEEVKIDFFEAVAGSEIADTETESTFPPHLKLSEFGKTIQDVGLFLFTETSQKHVQ